MRYDLPTRSQRFHWLMNLMATCNVSTNSTSHFSTSQTRDGRFLCHRNRTLPFAYISDGPHAFNVLPHFPSSFHSFLSLLFSFLPIHIYDLSNATIVISDDHELSSEPESNWRPCRSPPRILHPRRRHCLPRKWPVIEYRVSYQR
jgi:hypothetical protein